MRVSRADGGIERKVLIGLITSPELLGRLSPHWPKGEGLFRSKWANTVAGWCVYHYRTYGKAPGRSVEGLFENWEQENAGDKETVGLVSRFLEGLGEEYEREEQPPVEWLAARAEKHFNEVRVRRLKEALEGDLDGGKVTDALQRLQEFTRLQVAEDGETDVLLDEAAVREALSEEDDEDLITFPGDLGKFFRGTLTRGSFVGLTGPEKRGKTNLLLEFAWTAMLQRRRMAFFEVGDMSRKQILRRFMSRASRRPRRPGTLRLPTSLKVKEEGPEVTFHEREFKYPLFWQKAWAACQEVMKSKVRSKKSYLKLIATPTLTLTVSAIKARVEEWARRDWVPDVVCVDYPDILAPEDRRADKLEQTNMKWAGLRALSLSGAQPLVIVPTQATRASYRAEVITMEHTGEDKRKLAHVTGMVGLNQTPEEKDQQLLRLNWVVLREREYSTWKCVTVAGCPALASPCLLSAF